jgi:hypothetical protein
MMTVSRVAAAALLLAAGASLHASSPKFFTAGTQADFLKGEVENLSIDSRGHLLLGPATELVYETPAPFLWTIAAAADGALFIGTGNDGRVFKVDAQGKGAPFFDAQELEVHAVAPTQDGGLYVATSPDGKIYKVDRTGNATTFFDPSEKYIWAMVADRRGNVYAATGEGGVIYRITADGKSSRFYVTKATHATALALDRDDNLLVGTESPGRVLRIDAAGRGFVLLDTPFQEIRALRFDANNVLYVAAVNGSATGTAAPRPDDRPDRSGEPPPAPVASVSAEITSFAIVDTQGGATTTTVPRDDRTRGGVSHRSGRAVGSTLAVARRHAVRRHPRSGGTTRHRNRRQRQDLQARRGSAPAHPARAGQRATGDRPSSRLEREPRLRDRQSRQDPPPDRGTGRSRHLRVRATRRADGLQLGHHQLAWLLPPG